ncbi:MAG TPA: class I mannose-6-phosphate isomerase [Allosphingosinicella sp.]|nr:class I mannose-6-phosphate isomerase [Allosphingosinicella sp.]
MLTRLTERRVGKAWGRSALPEPFRGGAEGKRIGEILFEHPSGGHPDLLVKYLFTAQNSSIQVHPNDQTARAAGHDHGKDEAWITLSAEPGAVIGSGLREAMTRDDLRAAALDGSIAGLIDWRPAAAGEIYYSPAGTIHALGPGLVLLEIQQNADVTYRLYDYGRDRPLHRAEGVEAAELAGTVARERPELQHEGRETLSARGVFVLERWRGLRSARLDPGGSGPIWLIPLQGAAFVGGETLEPGSVWMAEGPSTISQDPDGQLIAAYCGGAIRPGLLG